VAAVAGREYYWRVPSATRAVTTSLQQQLQGILGPDYLIERELGGGGMSHVFLAEEKRLGRRVVVKVLRPELGAGLSGERFEREIRLAAALQDPRIVPLLQAGHSEELRYYTMPYVEGETLRARLARGSVPPGEAISILRDVALALEYAHARQVVHRDIKPENILLTGRTAVVADFGIAKAISAATEAGAGGTLTGFGSVVGTPAYMAPEQAAGDRVDTRTDLYAWGVIAYEMLAGSHPFASHTTAQALLAAHISEVPAPLAERRRDLPAGLTTLVDQCLAKDPGQRPADAAAVLEQCGASRVSHPFLASDALVGVATAPTIAALRRSRRPALVVAVIAIVLVAAGGGWLWRRSEARRWAREEAVPLSRKLYRADRTLAALWTLRRAAGILPADTQVAHALERVTQHVTITSSPPGATVAVQDYVTPDSAWTTLGTTPLSVDITDGYLRWKVSKAGVGEVLAAPETEDTMRFALDSARAAPEGMVPVSASRWGDMIAFIGWVGPFRLPAFHVDRFEVTNRQYQAFVDSGGYRTGKYWHEAFVRNGRALSWTDAMPLFRDKSGRAGPATWEGGHYPDGQDDYPVNGVSWYEASAYAAFVGKSLPSYAQWFEVAPGELANLIVQQSNISRSGLARVGAFKGLGPYGTYDMAGNVREWTMTVVGTDRRFILGGAWNSLTYLAADPEALSPFDRSPENGIRCVRNLGPLPPELTRPVQPLERDFVKFRPASDAVFSAYRVSYAYGKSPLNVRDEGLIEETKDWREVRVSFDAAYGTERMAAHLFLPKRVKPPYQTVLFFPSARVSDLEDSHQLGDASFFTYIIQSGRAVMYPVYQDTYERRTRHTMPGASQDFGVTVMRAKDVERALDYLETRPDIARDKVAYLGVSMGAAEGVIYATLAQDRLKAAVFLDGGYFLDPPHAGGDQADFAPRLKIPVLMVNGRYDFTFSLERSQEPLFRMLGTPAADKKHVVLETPHDVRADRADLVKEVLGWLDKYLGRVE
jgi:type II secretory pathway pseudopilin PulG